ncbi:MULTISPECIES: outer membrane protein assembly factor BamB family protein [unclassified Nocardia]|uniref:outer membrane protein assembly factor BamB family protein n=1 Tax=unclassified Nocardia TaxID=2637762 RepID=UPI0033A698D1
MGESTSADRARTTVDDPPTSLPTLERPLGRLARPRALAAAAGTGLLAGGVALALVSQYGTTAVSVDDRFAQPTQVAVVATELGGLALVIALVAWITGRRRAIDLWNRQHTWEQIATGAIGLIIAVLAGLAWREHLPSSYDALRATLPYFAQLPTAVAATILVGTGAILVLPLTIHTGVARTIGRGATAAAVAAGLVIAATASTIAIRAGDDNANVDHRTAAPTPMPALPARVGAEAYRLQLPPLNNRPEATGREIIPAGTGFVIAGIDGLRAYDGATGELRWHYLRRPQSGKRVFTLERGTTVATADRSVVTTRWDGPRDQRRRITFDAVTGQILWTSDDDNDFADLDEDRTTRLLDTPAADTLIVETAKEISGFDARTAAHRWSTTRSAAGCLRTDEPTQVTATTIYRLLRCGADWRITALNASTGDTVASRDVVADDEPRLELLSNTLLARWGGRDRTYLLTDTPEQLASAPLRTAGWPFAADPTGPAVLVGSAEEPEATLTTTGDTATTPVPELTQWTEGSVLLLTDEIVTLTFDDSPTLSRWDRRNLSAPSTIPFNSTCRPKKTTPQLMPVSSALLTVCQNNEENGDATLDIIGFR